MKKKFELTIGEDVKIEQWKYAGDTDWQYDVRIEGELKDLLLSLENGKKIELTIKEI